MAGAIRRFSKEAEIKTKFEVIFFICLCFIVCLYLITEICLADYLSVVFFMFMLLTTVNMPNKKKMAGATPLSPTHNIFKFGTLYIRMVTLVTNAYLSYSIHKQMTHNVVLK